MNTGRLIFLPSEHTGFASASRITTNSTSSGGNPSESQPEFSGEIPIDKLQLSYCRSGGPGGQHVNKVATKVEIRFHVDTAAWIPDWIKPKLAEKERNRITKDGVLILTSDKTRKQILNQADCLNRLRTMIYDVSKKPKELTPEDLARKEARRKKRAAIIVEEKRYNSLKKTARGPQ